MKRILVGVDGSEVATGALKFAAAIARATGAEMLLGCSIEPLLFYGADATGQIVAAQYETASATAKRTLAEATALLAGEGIVPKTVVMEGPAADALAELAKEGVDLCVVGHRSRGAVARVMLGSVADRLVQICPCPVLVFRHVNSRGAA